MGIFDQIKDAASGENLDKAKDFVNEHEAQVDQGIERAGDMIDEKTGGRYAGKVDQAQSFLEGKTGNL